RLDDDARDLLVELGHHVVGRHDRVGDLVGGDAGRVGRGHQRHRTASSDQQLIRVAGVAAGELHQLRPPGEPAGAPDARHPVRPAPLHTSRTMSTDGTRDTISSARRTSRSVGAPYDVPSAAASITASTTTGWAWPAMIAP